MEEITAINEILVACPANRFTGGPTLAHQLCNELIDLGYSASMFYYNRRGHKNLIHENYKYLNLPVTNRIVDHDKLILVVPETNVKLLNKIKKGKRILWWMSVDNYYEKYRKSNRFLYLTLCGLLDYKFTKSSTVHLVQSEYAREHLKSIGIKERVLDVSDFLNDDFLKEYPVNKDRSRKNLILYSPKRGLEISMKLMKLIPDFEWIPLENMSQNEMISLMRESKLFIDFGNHPGKDRIPREAAMMGCVVVTGMRGSAGNDIDINIPSLYKFDDSKIDASQIKQVITDIMINYDIHVERMIAYRNKIASEKTQFRIDVDKVFSAF